MSLLALTALECGGSSFEAAEGMASGGSNSSGGAAGSGGSGNFTGGASSGGAESSGGSSLGGQLTGGATSTGGVSNSGGATNSGGRPGETCTDYQDAASQSSIEFHIFNGENAPMYIPGPACGYGPPPMTIASSGGEPVAWGGLDCGSCSQIMEYGAALCPGLACAPPGMIRIDPGATVKLSWNGLKHQQVDLPPECVKPNGQANCQRITRAPDGRYTAGISGHTAVKCFDAANCDCLPQNGVCTVMGAEPAGEIRHTQTEFVIPAIGDVELSF